MPFKCRAFIPFFLLFIFSPSYRIRCSCLDNVLKGVAPGQIHIQQALLCILCVLQHARSRLSLQSSSSLPPLSSQPPRVRSLYNTARRPLDPNKQYRDDLGPCDVICPNCGAFHWIDERLLKSTKAHPKFSTCCSNGQIYLDPLPDAPPLLRSLFQDDSPGILFYAAYYANIKKHVLSVLMCAITTTPCLFHLMALILITPSLVSLVYIPFESGANLSIVSVLSLQ